MKELLEAKGFVVKMPSLFQESKDESGSQLTTDAANQSRLVTMTRWIVEASHGRVKQVFGMFEETIAAQYFNNHCDKKLRLLWRISCAIVNKSRPPIFKDSAKHEQYLEEIEKRNAVNNSLQEEVKLNRWDTRRVCWQPTIAQAVVDFPKISDSDLDRLTLGTYQSGNAESYINEHFRESNEFRLFKHSECRGLLRVHLKSRFRNSAAHDVFIEHGTFDGEEKIKRYYCKCKVGSRTLGCCSHVASVVWYLGLRRHSSPSFQPKSYGSGILTTARARARLLRNNRH